MIFCLYDAIIQVDKNIFNTKKDTKSMFLDTGDNMLYKTNNKFYIDKIGNTYNQHLSKDFDFKGESHFFLEAMYVVSGGVRVAEDEKVYILNEGDVIFFAPMEFHCVKSLKKTALNLMNLSFTVKGDLPSKIFDGVYHLNAEQKAIFIKCFNLAQLYEADNKNNEYIGQYSAANLTSLIIDICTELEAKDAFLTETSARVYTQIVNTMQKSVCDNFSLSDLASSHNISVSYLKKLFMTYANTSPKTFYNSLRAKEAARLLRQGLSVTSTAEKMNFSSPNYFSLFFKKHLGSTPNNYKTNSI